MPTVPRYEQKERPRGYQNVTPSRGGEIMAAAWQKAGQALQGTGDNLGSIAMDMADKQNKAVAQEAMTAYEDLRHTYWAGVVENRKGKNALGDAETKDVITQAAEWQRDTVASLLEGKNDAQKRLLTEYLDKRGLNLQEQAQTWQNNQWETYEAGQAKAFQQAQLQRAMDDPAQLPVAMANFATSVMTYNRGRGVSEEETSLAVQEGWDKTGAAIVRQYIKGDDLRKATATLDQYEKDLSPATVRELRAELKTKQEEIQAKAEAKRAEALEAESYAQAAEWAAEVLASDDPAAVDKKRAEIMQEPDAKKRKAQLANFNAWVSVQANIQEATYGKQAVDAVLAVEPQYREQAKAAALANVPEKYRAKAEAQVNEAVRQAQEARNAELQGVVNMVLRTQQLNGWSSNEAAQTIMQNQTMDATDKIEVLRHLEEQREGEGNKAQSAAGLAEIRQLKDQHPEWGWDKFAALAWKFNMNAADIKTAQDYGGKAAKITQTEFAAAYKKSTGQSPGGAKLTTLYDAFLKAMPDGKEISTDDMKRWCDKAAFQAAGSFFSAGQTDGEAVTRGEAGTFVLSRDYYTPEIEGGMRTFYQRKGIGQTEADKVTSDHIDLYLNLSRGIPTAGFLDLADLEAATPEQIRKAVTAWKKERDAQNN